MQHEGATLVKTDLVAPWQRDAVGLVFLHESGQRLGVVDGQVSLEGRESIRWGLRGLGGLVCLLVCGKRGVSFSPSFSGREGVVSRRGGDFFPLGLLLLGGLGMGIGLLWYSSVRDVFVGLLVCGGGRGRGFFRPFLGKSGRAERQIPVSLASRWQIRWSLDGLLRLVGQVGLLSL